MLQGQLFPNTSMIFNGNSAVRLGGAIGIDNIRVEEDLIPIFNYQCFLQYNVGRDDELCPSSRKVHFSFDSVDLTFHLIITQHLRDIVCMLKISVGVHLLVIL